MQARVGVVMGSRSDWGAMKSTTDTLEALGVGYEVRILSAHRTPQALSEWVEGARERGLRVMIAAAGGAAHLAGVVASKTTLPVLGVPMESQALKGMDSLLSTVQMPAGIPVATLAIGKAGAVNAALLAAQILGTEDPAVAQAVRDHREVKASAILADPDPRLPPVAE